MAERVIFHGFAAGRCLYLRLTGMVIHLVVRMLNIHYNDSYENHDPIGKKNSFDHAQPVVGTAEGLDSWAEMAGVNTG